MNVVRKKKKKIRINKKRVLFLAVTTFLFFYFVITIVGQQTQIKDAKSEYVSLSNNLSEQLVANEALLRLSDKENDREYFERIAREQLGYVMPGERVFYDISGS